METKDALLHAINEEFVEAVEVLLEHEETIHKEGEPHVSSVMRPLVTELELISTIAELGGHSARHCQFHARHHSISFGRP